MCAVRSILFFALLGVCLENIYAAPKPNQALGERQELVQRFAEFLREDKEFSGALQQVDWDSAPLARERRQATTRAVESDEFDSPPEKPGFFDRAAKFVTELLQRFLKWVNSNDNN